MIRWMILAALALTLGACNDTAMQGQDKRLKKHNADATPGFSLANSQTCGTKPPAELPVDETTAENGTTLADLGPKLESEGLDGWVHAAVAPFGEYVFTYRKRGNFFDHVEMAMIPANDEVAKSFAGIIRNDKVHVVGTLVNKLSPLGHILVSSLTVLKKYEPETARQGYSYSESLADLAAELKGKTALYGVVHAQTTDGGVLVLDYKDMVIPIFVSERHREFAKTLWRGDVVGIAFTIRQSPNEPLHLETKATVNEAVLVYDHMVWCHDQKATLTGELVLFEKSPQITRNVYALRNTDSNGMQRNWTLVNFDDEAAFTAIQAKIENAWKTYDATAEKARNQLINLKLKITATGTMNVVSPSQANPQVLLDGPDAITLEVLE